jgi:hypothetical protein
MPVPSRLARYSQREWGKGDEGIRAWKAAALAWLREDPSRRLPVGREGDPLDVLREAVRLMGGRRG